MRYKNIIVLFCITLPFSVLLRLVQLRYTVDENTGFFIKEYSSYGNLMLYLIFGLAFLPAVFSFVTHRRPDKPPYMNVFLRICSALLGTMIILRNLTEQFADVVPVWQITPLKIFGILSGIFFVLYPFGFGFSKVCFAFPVIYSILKIVATFTEISSLALISDNLIIICTYCVILIFMLQLAKLYNGLDLEVNFRKIMASGFCAVSFGLIQSVPLTVMDIYTKKALSLSSLGQNIEIFLTACFILGFLLSHFSYSNACAKH